jgi:microcystin-dependent protein
VGTPFLGEVRVVSFNFAPKGWALCNGQLLPINQNQALFSLLGTTYGGDGITTFALPDLRGRSPLHFGTNPADGTNSTQGENGGEETHTLTLAELAAHTHKAVASAASPGSQTSPAGNTWANGNLAAYSPNATVALAAQAVGPAGGGAGGAAQPHENMAPFLVLNFIIAINGIFPSRN